MRDELVLETTEQIRALAHPLRQRVLHLLTDVPYTNKQLAMALQVSPPRLHFHVRELQAAGLIEIVSEQPKRGVIEKYYRAVARTFRLRSTLSQEFAQEEVLESSLEVTRQELIRAMSYFGDHLPLLAFAHEPLRLSKERLAHLKGHLEALNQEMLQAMADPERDTYEDSVVLSYLLHSLPPGKPDASHSTEEHA
ncbi:MAG TPA: winged helix-turn-helix domain-containing protein [Ktedonobacteraceae bacterium]|jgi:DNA-binding transcriptional ArsR family regulator|nr:winged helix-turn-helix domain-containing protein [Ktedonobacteraceae bacterium]